MITNKPEYLGDAVYANIDEQESLIITTGSHLENEADNIIFLEPSVILKLVLYLKKHCPEIISLSESFQNNKK